MPKVPFYGCAADITCEPNIQTNSCVSDWTSQEEKGVASKVPITISFNEPLEYVFRTYAGHITAPVDKSSICNYVHCNVMCGMKSFIHSQTLWSLRMDKIFHPALYQACDYLSLLGLKLNHVNEMDRRFSLSIYIYIYFWSICGTISHHSKWPHKSQEISLHFRR